MTLNRLNAADYLEERADQAKHEAEDRAAEILQLEARIEAFREYQAEALARESEMRAGARMLREARADAAHVHEWVIDGYAKQCAACGTWEYEHGTTHIVVSASA